MNKKCPICGKLAIAEAAPFCSQRCKSLDLNRWLSEVYRVPGKDALESPVPANDEGQLD